MTTHPTSQAIGTTVLLVGANVGSEQTVVKSVPHSVVGSVVARPDVLEPNQ